MPIGNVAVDDPVQASTMNALIDNVNGSPNRVVFLNSGVWNVPAGVQRFKVWICGGGGSAGDDWFVGEQDGPGAPGGDSPLISAIFVSPGQGTAYPITIGAGGVSNVSGGVGGTTSFGATFSSSGGLKPSYQSVTKGGPGTASFPVGAPSFFHTNEMFCQGYYNNVIQGYGRGGNTNSQSGRQGICVIEW